MFTGRPYYGYHTPKIDSYKEENFKSKLPKQVIVNDTQLHRNVTVRKNKRRSYVENVKIPKKVSRSKKREENKEPLDTGYEKND